MLDQLREHRDRKPFHPFRIVTSSGDRYDILTPYQVAIAQTYVFYAIPRSNRSARIRLDQIGALETMEPAEA